jgi:hypothetical protein
MVELALHESLDAIWLESVVNSKGEQCLRVHVSFDHSSEDLNLALLEQGLGEISSEVIALFGDDSVKRLYETTPDFVIVRPGSS